MSTVAREKGAIFCPVHPKKKLAFLCKKCNILICNKCIAKEHSGHPVEEVEEVVEKKFRKLDEFILNTEDTTIPRTKKDFKQVEAQVSARVKELEAGIEKAYEHERYLIELVQRNTKKTVSELKGELQTINQQLSQFKSESDTYLDNLKSAINECKESKKTKNDILLIIHVVNSVDTLSNTLPTCQFPKTRNKFTPGANPVVDIENAFGCISTDGEASVGIQTSKDKSKLAHNVKTQDLQSKGTAAATKNKQLLSKPQVTSWKDLQSAFPNSVEKFSDGTLCYCGSDEPYVYLINKSGDIKEVKLDISARDIAIHPTTDVLYSLCYSDKSIRTVDIHTGTTSVVFTTVDTPCCVAFTADGTILVSFFRDDKIVNYSLRGEVLRSVNVQSPWHIYVCAFTGNIVIAAYDSGAQVMNNDFQTVFNYKGPTDKKQSKKELNCWDAVFDSEGHILVSDYHNKKVHVVDANTGKHLSTIDSDKFGDIQSLGLDQDGGLVVGTSYPHRLVFVKYI